MVLNPVPWHEDVGQEWIKDILDKTSLLKLVRETLNLSPEENHVQIRLAAEVIWILKCGDVEAVTDQDVTLSLEKLKEVTNLPLYSEQNPEAGSLVDHQIESLEIFCPK